MTINIGWCQSRRHDVNTVLALLALFHVDSAQKGAWVSPWFLNWTTCWKIKIQPCSRCFELEVTQKLVCRQSNDSIVYMTIAPMRIYSTHRKNDSNPVLNCFLVVNKTVSGVIGEIRCARPSAAALIYTLRMCSMVVTWRTQAPC